MIVKKRRRAFGIASPASERDWEAEEDARKKYSSWNQPPGLLLVCVREADMAKKNEIGREGFLRIRAVLENRGWTPYKTFRNHVHNTLLTLWGKEIERLPESREAK